MKQIVPALATFLCLAIAAGPASACLRQPSTAAIDTALVSAQLSRTDATRVATLRNDLVDALRRRDWQSAMAAESRAMAIMGLAYEEQGPQSRGGCNGRWVRRRG